MSEWLLLLAGFFGLGLWLNAAGWHADNADDVE